MTFPAAENLVNLGRSVPPVARAWDAGGAEKVPGPVRQPPRAGDVLMPQPKYCLSLKQPWAALLVHARKTVEVRSWPTARRGPILIHAARVPDARPEAWDRVPDELRAAAELRGGIVGAGDLTGCVAYRDQASFTADRERHLNDPAWYRGPVLYGFTFADLRVLPFVPCPGWMRFFPVELELPAS